MKAWSILPALAVLVACAPASEDTAAAPAENTEVTGPYSEDNLAFSDACFAEDRSGLLEEGQTLLERSPDGTVRISHALDGAREDYLFQVLDLNEDHRQLVEGAAANFFRTAGVDYNVTTDDVIYHREMDGSFCAVVKNRESGMEVATAARTVQAELDASAQDNTETPDMPGEQPE
ncbi:hypothetical protein RMQ97_00380 [Maricaulis sp. D1M11]|uniref:hypothetical protein n=1 Tax=Maricaulis sp. D1M11 TaxID=3076117 RepID=UPI0039B3F9C1